MTTTGRWMLVPSGDKFAPKRAFARRRKGYASKYGAYYEYANEKGISFGYGTSTRKGDQVVGPIELAVLHTEFSIPVVAHNFPPTSQPDVWGFLAEDFIRQAVTPLLDQPKVRAIWRRLNLEEEYEKLLERSRSQDKRMPSP